MGKIKYTSGTLQRIDSEYFNLILSNNDKVVYKATLPKKDAAQLIDKSNKITIIK